LRKISVENVRVTTIVSAPFSQNSYVASRAGSHEAVVVDPGMEPGKILANLDGQQLTPTALLITHGHSDHIAGIEAMKRRWPAAPIVIGRREADKLEDPVKNLSAEFGFNLVTPPAELLLDDGDIYEAAGLKFETREIPGHSSGHVVFICRDATPWLVFGGDVLFSGSVGRCDFPDGDFEQLAGGIWRHLFSLPDDTVVLSGHGPPTTIGEEKRENPYVGHDSQYGRTVKNRT
jgi:glyoxylase-like metal-dependent hydrolase (beta-lactamase superfamily II)